VREPNNQEKDTPNIIMFQTKARLINIIDGDFPNIQIIILRHSVDMHVHGHGRTKPILLHKELQVLPGSMNGPELDSEFESYGPWFLCCIKT
jgi:hypothetical protein